MKPWEAPKERVEAREGGDQIKKFILDDSKMNARVIPGNPPVKLEWWDLQLTGKDFYQEPMANHHVGGREPLEGFSSSRGMNSKSREYT
jgi:hypothetical protein